MGSDRNGGSEEHTVFVGSKPFMKVFSVRNWITKSYVTGVVMQFTTQGAKEVVVKARGKFISRAVDIAEVTSKRFLQDQLVLKGMKIDSEEFQNKEGKQVRVSTIEITLAKK